jgi:hypothetical protein
MVEYGLSKEIMGSERVLYSGCLDEGSSPKGSPLVGGNS